MKKVLKITGVILGVLIIAVIVIAVFFPGLPTYIKVKKDYPEIDRIIEEFEPADIPDTFKDFNLNGISFKAPADYEETESSSVLRSADKEVQILIIHNDAAENAEFLEKYGYSSDPWEYYEYDESDYRSFFEAVGDTYPEDYDADSDLLWFIKDRLNSKMCLKLRSTDRKVFLEFADIKKTMWETEDAWKIDGDGFSAYISTFIDDTYYTESMWTVNIYLDDSESEYYFGAIKGADAETARQIISSMQIIE